MSNDRDRAASELPVDPDLLDSDRSSPFPPGARRSSTRRWDVALVIAAGGAMGGAARWLVNQVWPPTTGTFPWSTFVENVTGCLLLAALMVFLLDVWSPGRYLRPFLGTGVLGGYTTFSTYTADTAGLLRAGQTPVAIWYLFGTLAAGLAATWIGMATVRGLVVRPRTERRRHR